MAERVPLPAGLLEQVFQDLKDISSRFIEIPDLEPSRLFQLTDEGLDYIETSVGSTTALIFLTINPLRSSPGSIKKPTF